MGLARTLFPHPGHTPSAPNRSMLVESTFPQRSHENRKLPVTAPGIALEP